MLYATALFTELRAGKLAGLLRSNVNIDRRLIAVKHSVGVPT